MNVFVLCTGRCGSVTFIEACRHITNHTAGHETRSKLLGKERFAFPDRHIEADPRFAWMLGRLEAAYGQDAFYVHLRRDPEAVAESLAEKLKRRSFGLPFAYYVGVISHPLYVSNLFPAFRHATPVAVCRDMVETVTANIEAFLRGKRFVSEVWINSPRRGFAEMWQRIGAQGDWQAALAEFDTAHNAREAA